MARSSQYWVVLLVVLCVAAATASLVSAEEPNLAEQTQVTLEEEAAPSFAEKIEATKDSSKKQAAQAGASAKSWKDWATKQVGDWTGRGQAAAGGASESAKAYATQSAESLHSSSAKAQESASGAFNKWSKWAKDTAGKYTPKKNPAAETAESVKKHSSGVIDEEL